MNHIRLLIRNQCGSHIIHGIRNPLAFQQNYSRYDGPSESGSFFTLSKPGLKSFLHTGVLKSQEKCPHGNKTLRDAWHKTQQTAEVCVYGGYKTFINLINLSSLRNSLQ